jgi:hypothetical protein
MSHMELYHLSKITSAGKGLVFREVPMYIIKMLFVDEEGVQPKLAALVAKANKSQNEKNRLEYAQSVNTILKSRRFCGDPVTEEFERLTKLAGYKTDQRIVICMTQVRTAVPPFSLDFVVCGIGGWSVFDPQDEVDLPELRVNAAFDTHAQEGRVAEIDLVCTSGPAPPGTGQAILARLLGIIAKTRKQGGRRFRAVVANKAVGANNAMPFTKLGERFGMFVVSAKRAGMGVAPARDSDGALKKYCVAMDTNAVKWEHTSKEYLSNDRVLSMCPIKPRSGRSYCS